MNFFDVALKSKEELKKDLANMLSYNDLLKLTSACKEVLESGIVVDIAESEIVAWLEHLEKVRDI